MPVNRCGFGHTRNGQTVGLEYLMLYKKKKKAHTDVVQIPFLANLPLCQHITFTSGRNSGAADVRERRASAFFNKWRHVWYSHRCKMKKKKVPFIAGLTCLNKVQMCAEWCEVRWRFWEEMIKFHGSDSELGIIWLCCMYSLLYYLELVCQRSIRSVAAIYQSVKKNEQTNASVEPIEAPTVGLKDLRKSSTPPESDLFVIDPQRSDKVFLVKREFICLTCWCFHFKVSCLSFVIFFFFLGGGIRFLCLPTLQSAPVLLLLSDPLTAGCCRWLLVICLCVMVPCCALQNFFFAVQLATIRRVALCRSAAVMLCKYWNLTHASNQEGGKKKKQKMFIMKVLRMQRCEWVSAADWKNSDWVEFKIFRKTQEWPFMISIIFIIALSFFNLHSN